MFAFISDGVKFNEYTGGVYAIFGHGHTIGQTVTADFSNSLPPGFCKTSTEKCISQSRIEWSRPTLLPSFGRYPVIGKYGRIEYLELGV